MRRFQRVECGLAFALGLGAGCGATDTVTKPTDPNQVEASIQANLGRLRALNVMEVGGMVLDLPAEATACYGAPCAGSEWVEPYQEERARQAERLQKLADLAKEVVYNPSYLTPHAANEADAAAQALAALQVVQVEGLVLVEPANNPQCYNLPCESDVEVANAANAQHVTLAFGIADAAKRSGL